MKAAACARARDDDDAKISAPPPRPRSADPNVLLGVAASPGTRGRHVFQVPPRGDRGEEEGGTASSSERRLLADAIDKARGQLEALRAQLHAKADPAKAAIFAAHAELLDDPDFLEIANSAMAKGKSAAFAWKSAAKTPRRAPRLVCATNCSRNAPTTCATSACACSNCSPASRKAADLSRRLDPHRRRSHALRHRHDGTRHGGRLRHRARRRDFARRHSRALARDSRHRRHRAARARSRQRHAGHSRWRQRFAAAESAARGDRAHPRSARRGTKRSARRTWRMRTSRP